MKTALTLLAFVGLSSAAVQVLSPEHLRQIEQIVPSTRQDAAIGRGGASDLQQYLALAKQAVIVHDDYQVLDLPDLYVYDTDTSNGIRHRQAGALVNPGTKDEALNVAGQYSYYGPDGQLYRVFYTADENGFQPAGEHLPPAASTHKKPQLGIPSGAIASLAGGGLG